MPVDLEVPDAFALVVLIAVDLDGAPVLRKYSVPPIGADLYVSPEMCFHRKCTRVGR